MNLEEIYLEEKKLGEEIQFLKRKKKASWFFSERILVKN